MNTSDNFTSFKDYIFKNVSNRSLLIISAIVIIIQISIYKYFYPYASYIHGDSFVYLETAYKNLDINTYMVGYSRFLRLFSVFTNSDTILVIFQYLLVQASSLCLLYTLFYFHKVKSFFQIIATCFMVLNPLFLNMANLISSDCYFLSLSMIWVTLLIWVIHRPTARLVIVHMIILYICFTVRYNALIYPIISLVAFFLSRLSIKHKIISLSISFIPILAFIIYTGNKYKSQTGTWQYAPFSGWQLTNNAMYAYRFVDSAAREPVPPKFQALDNMIRTYFDTTRNLKKHPEEAMLASTVYMWSPGLTMYKYRNLRFKNDSTSSEFKKWAYMGPFYKSYGIYIIKKYPWKYLRYFIFPNACKYYAPPVEFLESYNSGKDSVAPIAKLWFDYKSRKLFTRAGSPQINMLNFYPVFTGVVNIVMLSCLLCFYFLKSLNKNKVAEKTILLGAIIWIVNATFTILASSVALRFQSFSILLTFLMDIVLIDWMLKLSADTKISDIASKKSIIEYDLTEKSFVYHD